MPAWDDDDEEMDGQEMEDGGGEPSKPVRSRPHPLRVGGSSPLTVFIAVKLDCLQTRCRS